MDSSRSETFSSLETSQDYRVRLTSKKTVTEQIDRYKEVLRSALDGQADVDAETKRVLVEELLANFEAAVQVNVLVNEQAWEDAPDVEEDDLEKLLDDTIVEIAQRRRTYPKKILPHVVHGLKAQRKIMGLYELAVKPEEVIKDPDQESIMGDLSAAAPAAVRQTVQVLKSLNTLHQQARGLCEVLNMKPSQASLEVHREVFGFSQAEPAPPPRTRSSRSQLPIKRALEKAAEAEGYVAGCGAAEHEPDVCSE